MGVKASKIKNNRALKPKNNDFIHFVDNKNQNISHEVS